MDAAADPYAAFPSFEPPRAVRPASARITTPRPLPPDLVSFLDRFTSAVEAGRWGAVALFLEEELLRSGMQSLTGRGMSPQDAAEEILLVTLGLDQALPATAGAAPFESLARLSTMTVDGTSPDGSTATRVEGYVRMDDRSTPRFGFSVRATPHGPRVIVPRF